MLPDYPSIKDKIQRKIDEALNKEIQKDPLLSQIKIQYVNEGDISTSTSINGYHEKIVNKLICAGFEITKEEIIDKGPRALFSKIPKIAEEIVKGRSRVFFEKMEEVTERTGNVVSSKSGSITPQIILDALEKVQIDFDEQGNPIFPSLILNEEQYEKIKDEIPKWESDGELQKKHKELIEKKRREWIDRENNRKLVD